MLLVDTLRAGSTSGCRFCYRLLFFGSMSLITTFFLSLLVSQGFWFRTKQNLWSEIASLSPELYTGHFCSLCTGSSTSFSPLPCSLQTASRIHCLITVLSWEYVLVLCYRWEVDQLHKMRSINFILILMKRRFDAH